MGGEREDGQGEGRLSEGEGEAERAFDAGDFREARRLSRAALAGGDEAHRQSAARLLARFRHDRLLGLVYLVAAVLCAVTVWLTTR